MQIKKMINIDVVLECKLWSKKIKKKNIFFNSLVNFFPKKYRFIKKKVSLTILLSNNKNIKKLNKGFRKKNTYLGDIIISYEFINIPKSQTLLQFKKKISFFNLFIPKIAFRNYINANHFLDLHTL